MGRLTDAQVLTISEAAALGRIHREVLSDFEAELVKEIGRRFVEFGRHTVITPAEWLPFSTAVEAMRREHRAMVARTEFLARTRSA